VTTHSYDAGEQLRVTGGSGVLRIEHGANEIARIKTLFGGKGIRIEAGDRAWRVTQDEDGGWTAAGDPPARLQRNLFRPAVLTIGDTQWKVRRRTVQGLLRFRSDDAPGRPALKGEILAPPPPQADAHALMVLAAAAVAIGLDLSAPLGAHSGINGDNRSAALTYGIGH
jgi:hypothetical protein